MPRLPFLFPSFSPTPGTCVMGRGRRGHREPARWDEVGAGASLMAAAGRQTERPASAMRSATARPAGPLTTTARSTGLEQAPGGRGRRPLPRGWGEASASSARVGRHELGASSTAAAGWQGEKALGVRGEGAECPRRRRRRRRGREQRRIAANSLSGSSSRRPPPSRRTRGRPAS